ncbi:hypothetical protein BGZ95_000327 [Linnemannia exigua]|uniref:Superoxide dismutase copper/zinc binding domain-containing protein n=1 Tax=Linnemannia exigua TaxID=604196 RepID=A0AAD4H4F4_9FUNG|nr:hypothetical protein BGZ95_000327 [Linnemannia exigua]
MLQKTSLAVTFLAALGCLLTTTQAQIGQSQIAVINMASVGGASVMIKIEKGLTRETALLPNVGFEYHIHVKPVGPGNNCEATGGHLDDPAHPGIVPCDSKTPDRCQEGDLSGKHGNLMVTPTGELQLRYNDNQLKFTGDTTTILRRSLVIHNNGTRIACANILPASEHQPANGLPPTQGLNQQQQQDGLGGSASSTGINAMNTNNGYRARSNNGHPSEGRFMSSETMWTALGSVACGIIAALMAF